MLDAIAQGFDQRIAVTYVEWGDAASQEVVVPWTIVDGPASAAAFAEALLEAPRRAFGRNAIGNAIAAAQALIEGQPVRGLSQGIDSRPTAPTAGRHADGAGARRALAADIVINGLAILCRPVQRPAQRLRSRGRLHRDDHRRPGELRGHRRRRRPFAEAVRKKLLLEIAGAPALIGRRPTFEASLVQR